MYSIWYHPRLWLTIGRLSLASITIGQKSSTFELPEYSLARIEQLVTDKVTKLPASSRRPALCSLNTYLMRLRARVLAGGWHCGRRR
jgi:hypothetical protein